MAQLSLHSPIGDLTISEEQGAIVALDWGWGRDQQPSALLRSVVVAPAWQRRGLGRRIVKALEREARAAGISRLVLLTPSAAAFFAGLGYQPIARAAAPAALHSSGEFRTLCPATAACLAKTLR